MHPCRGLAVKVVRNVCFSSNLDSLVLETPPPFVRREGGWGGSRNSREGSLKASDPKYGEKTWEKTFSCLESCCNLNAPVCFPISDPNPNHSERFYVCMCGVEKKLVLAPST